MKNIKDILFITQARLGSTRCPKKMIKPFAGSTLTEIVLSKIKKTIAPQQNIYFSAYEDELKEIAKLHNINIFHRSEKSTKWNGGKDVSTIFEWCNFLDFKYVIMINGCCPMLTVDTINSFIRQYLSSKKNGMFSVIKKQNYIWSIDGKILNHDHKIAAPDTKLVTPYYEAAHCLYAGSMQDIRNNIWMGDFSKKGDIEFHIVPEQECFDVDYEWEFDIYSNLYLAQELSDKKYKGIFD